MKPMIRTMSFAAALAFAASAHAAPTAVQSMTIDSGSFHVTTGSGPSGTGGAMTFYDTNLVAGAKNPILTFFLTDPLNPANSGTVKAFTTSASPAFVDGSTFSIDLSSFQMDWNTGPFPSLCTVESCLQPQNPQPSGVVSGSWDAGTKRFAVTWAYQWVVGQHPFPEGTTTWSLTGIANPVPEPSNMMLMAAGVLMVSGAAWRRRKG